MTREQAIDTHVHFWQLETYRPFSAWFGEKHFLEKDYLPADLKPALESCGVESAVIVGAAPDSDEHNLWCGELVERYAHVAALVGSYSFENENLGAALDQFSGKSWFVGIRARPASDPEEWVKDKAAERGVAELRRRGLVLDTLVDHTLLPAVATFAARHDDVPLVVNHCGLPPFSTDNLSTWASHIQQLAQCANVSVKYSSFLLHCHPHCEPDRLRFAAQTLLEHFGVERLLWGSNWPPELVGGTYADAYRTMLNAAGTLSEGEFNLIFRENAVRVYGLQT